MIRIYTRTTKILLLLLTFLGGMAFQTLRAQQQPAFPGAEGAGIYTTGGRGTTTNPTTVFEVTNLSDDGLPGSFRYALTASATYRTVVFRVSGTIHLASRLGIKTNTTIAGQTAPGDGICIADQPLVISGDNVIVRYIRVRLGDKNQNKGMVDGSGNDDALGGLGVSNIIIDHCSVSWSDDEALTIYRGDNLTIQWCFMSEPLNYSYHFESGDTDYEHHGYNGIQGSKHGTIHHNLYAHAKNRNPRFAGISTYTPNTPGVENVDFRNNVIYNWGINTVYGGEGGNYNVVNNYYKFGPSTSSGVRYRIANPSYATGVPYGKWYINGNYVFGSATNTNNNWSGVVMQSNVAADTVQSKVTVPFDLGYTVTTESATAAYESVLQGAGCTLPNRDTLDQRIVLNVRNQTGQIIDVQGGYPHGTAYPSTVNAWPALSSTAAPVDTDHDGMPDSWESSKGLDPNNSSDRYVLAPNGYTNLENYLNSLISNAVNTNPTVIASASLNGFSQTLGTPSAAQTFTVSGINLTSDITLTAPANYQLSLDGTSWNNSLTLPQNAGTVATTTMSVRLNATANGTYNGNITAGSTGATTVTIAVNGITTDAQLSQKQIIGIYPAMEGGFENQPAGVLSTAYPTGAANFSPSVWTSESGAEIKNDGTARTGNNYVTYTSTSTSTKNVYTPAVKTPLFVPGTKYIIQYYYRAPAPATGNQAGAIIAATDNTGTTNFTKNYATTNYTGTNNGWQKAVYVQTLSSTISYTINTCFAGFRMNGGGTQIVKPFDVEDFVVYPADDQSAAAADVTAPDGVTTPTASGNNSTNQILVSWTAPTTGVDGGGYVVVRSTSATGPAPNANGIYSIGGSMGADYTVVYIGAGSSFTDDGSIAPLANGTTYNYYIFTVDKAFNYAVPVKVSGALAVATPTVTLSGTLSNFSQSVGTPSLSKSFSVTGTNLTANLVITAPAGYEVSEDDNTWSTSLALSPVNGSVQTTVFVRLNASTAGTYNGTIQATSTGASAATLNVTGAATVPSPIPAGIDVVVAKDGSGSYISVQAAINAAPTGRTTPYKIYIKKGKYVETVNIPSTKPFIQLMGESVSETIISYDNYSGKANPAGGTYGTSTCATMIVSAPDVMVMNLSVENATAYGINANAIVPAPGDGPQAVAVYTTSDRVVFYNVRMNGGQDTYYGGNVEGTRVYFKNSYIDGNTDFMFGSSTIIFDTCIIYPRTRLDNQTGGYVTAVNTKQKSGYGYVFRDCKITKNRGTTVYTLGRPWQNDGGTADASKSWNKTVFLNTKMGSSITAPGWSTWDAGTNTSFITYAEYNSKKYDGITPVDVSGRVSWSKQLTAAEAAKYYNNDTVFINANTPAMAKWDPYAVWPELSKPFTPELVVSNLIGKKGTSASTINWNLSWPMPGVTLDLYRSTDKTNFTLVNSQVSTEDSAGNFTYSDAIPPAGQNYYYIVRASKAGSATITSDTTVISSTPAITVTGTMNSFLQGVGLPSSAQTYIISGVNLLDNVTITPPAGYEVSVNNSGTWYTNASPLVLTATNNAIANTTIAVRLNASTAGSYSGSITNTSAGAVTVNVPVTGSVQTDPLPIINVLQHWPMTQNNQDSAAIRSAGVTASTSTLNNFYVSNGTQVAGVTAYSSTRGQVFGPGTSGEGLWTTATGGPGGNLSRIHYEQFTVTATQGYTVRIDSILATSAFYGTSSNTKMAIIYSKSGFVSDSSDVAASTGTFSSPFVLLNQTGGPTSVWSASLNGATGITIQSGQTLTFRLYYSCGSTTAGRYAELRDVIVKGLATQQPTLVANGSLNSFSQAIGTPSAVQTYTLTGSNLGGTVTVTPPAGYEVSANGGTTWFTATTPLVITPVSGAVNSTISVRLNTATAGTYNGLITHFSTGVTTVNLPVSGSAVTTPQISVTGTLNNFAQTVGAPSSVQTYTVSGAALTSGVVITPPANYEVSSDGGTTWFSNASPLTLVQSNGIIASTTITVRLNAGAAGTYNGTISHASAGAATVTKAVSGTTVPAPAVTVTGTLNPFTHTVGAPSAAQTYTVSGSNLTGVITITAPANYQVSNGGTTWGSSVTLTPANGSVANTAISVRLNASAAGSYSGTITNATAGGNTVNVAVSGTTVPAPSISANGSLAGFSQTLGAPSAAKTYSVSGANLTGNITVVAPAGYELSTDGTNWTTNAVTLVQTAGAVTATLNVRLNVTTPGSYSGTISHTSAGAATVNLAVSGKAVLPPVLTVAQALTPFAQVYGTPSAVQTYTIRGANLVSNVTITAPNRYEISANGGANWTSTAVALVPSADSAVNATISIRLNGIVPGAYNGTINHSTTSVATIAVPVTGFNKANMVYGIYPVPTYRTAFVVHPAMTVQAEMQVYTIAGQKIATYSIAPGSTETPVDVSRMPQGVYQVVILNGSEKTVLRFIKK